MEMKPNHQVLATRRLRGPLLVCLALAACGEDRKVVTDVSDQSDAQVGDTNTSWSVAFTSPTDGALFGQNTPIPVSVALSGVDPSQALSFRATITLNDETIAGGSDVSFDAQGQLAVMIPSAGAGAHTLEVTVTGGGETASAERSFSVNQAPGIPTGTLMPEEPTTRDDLRIDPSSDDPTYLGEGVTFKYRWRKVGAAENLPSTTNVLSNIHTEKGDQIEVFVTPNDGFVDGPELRREATILNAAPSCTGVLMLPSALNVGQSVTCSCVGWEDADGDSDQSTCVFTDTVSGAVLETDGACTLDGVKVESGLTIACVLTPHDGEDAGTVVSTPDGGGVSVLNSRPSAPVATLSPAAGNALTAFTCELTSPGIDPDRDSVTHTTSWTVAGVAVVSEATTATGAELGAGKGDAVCCKIAASDGSTSSVSVPSCVTLENAPPPEVNVFVRVRGGGSASRRSTLDCEAEGASDPDGDAITVSYAWFVGGAQIPGAIGASLSAASIPRDSVVSCQATICDDAGLCTEPIASKTSVLIQNALPQVGDVEIVPDEAESHPGQTLTCAFSGWDDPDGDAAQVVYQWILIVNGVETVLASETSPDIDVEVSMAPGSQLVCRVTPMNGSNAGPTTSSLPRLIGEALPMAPTVAVVAPAGAAGPLTCQTTVAGQFIPAGATWTWRWSRNGVVIDVPSSTTLAGSEVSDCDLVRCWVEIRAPGLSLDSNQGSELMPLGDDCDDGNACTSATCFMGGGCNQVPQDGGPCDDGDACTENEVCQAGTCVGTLDVCVEDRVSVAAVTAPAGARVRVHPRPQGGYLTKWWRTSTGAISTRLFRLTDGEDTRLDEEFTAYSSGVLMQEAVSPSGKVGLFVTANATGNGYNNPPFAIGAAFVRYDADLGTSSSVPLASFLASSFSGGVGSYNSEVIAFSDESFGVLRSQSLGSAPAQGIRYQRVAENMVASAAISLVAPISGATTHMWAAAGAADGTDDFLLAWASSDAKTILVQRFSRDGASDSAGPSTVATTTGAFTAVRVTGLVNGRFVVAWQGTGVDAAGQGIAVQRFDESGGKVGGAIQVAEVESGDQQLGDLTTVGGTQFAVVWLDRANPSARVLGRVFASSGQAQPAIQINGMATAGSEAPTAAGLVDGTWVVVWRDAANVYWSRRFNADGTFAQGAAEFRANDAAASSQEAPVAASGGDGRVMIAYTSRVISSGDFATEIMARVFDEDGLEVVAEHIVHGAVQSFAQSNPVVAGSASGFVVAWNSEEEDGDLDGIFARRYDGLGRALDTENIAVNVSTSGYQRQPAIAMHTDGRWVAAWNAQSSTAGSTSDVVARVFSVDGVGGAELVLNTATANVQERPSLAMVPFANDFVAAWQSRSQDGDGLGIYVRRFGLDGVAKTVEFPVNTRTTGDQRNPTVAVSQTNQIAVCWESVGHVAAGKPAIACQYLRTSDLLPSGSEFLVFSRGEEQSTAVARFQADGRLAVAFQTLALDSASYGIQLVRANNLGVAVGQRLATNRTWVDAQTRPFLVPLDDRLFVGWQSQLQDGSEGGVFFRILSRP